MRDYADRGFSFVEVLIGLTIVLAAIAPLLHIAASGQRLARSQGEAVDLHQRLRVAVDRLRKDLTLAGAGSVHAPVSGLSGGLSGYLAPIVPARLGSRAPDAPLAAFTDRISIVYATDAAGPSPVAVDMASPSEAVPISGTAVGCPAAGLCGFIEGTRALVVDTTGVGAGHDLFTVTGNSGALAHDAPNPALHRPYAAGRSFVVPVAQRVYSFDRANRRLMLYDGHQSDMPFIDNVVFVRFEYFADASPLSVPWPATGTSSCVFNAGAPPVPRLDSLGADGLRPLALASMTDGPVCGAGPGAFDGDLLRIRMVRVTLRLQAGADEVRASGPLFAQPGRSSSPYSYVPDFEVTFDVTPRNMTPAAFRP